MSKYELGLTEEEVKQEIGETHRWMFCHDFVGHPESLGFPDDCACCMQGEEIKKCGCVCHERISQIVEFIESESLARSKAAQLAILDQVRIEEHPGRNVPHWEGYNEAVADLNDLIDTLKAGIESKETV